MEVTEAIDLINNRRILATSHETCWADLGCGTGLFTVALAHLLQPGSLIYAVDKNPNALRQIPQLIHEVRIEKTAADFLTDSVTFQNLDGIVLANSLHFVKDKLTFVQKAGKWLNKEGVLLVVEYDTDIANPWVPYPVSLLSLKALFEKFGYRLEKIHERPSRFNRAQMYAVLLYPFETV